MLPPSGCWKQSPVPLALRLGLWSAESSSDVSIPSLLSPKPAGVLLSVHCTGRGVGQDVSLAFAR